MVPALCNIASPRFELSEMELGEVEGKEVNFGRGPWRGRISYISGEGWYSGHGGGLGGGAGGARGFVFN